MSAEQSQKERVSPKEQVVWHRDMSTEQKMHAMGAAAEHFEAIAAGVNIKFSRSENSVPPPSCEGVQDAHLKCV